MYDEPRLSDEEWDLIVELLECERNELPVEIHHTRNASVRDGVAAAGGDGAEIARPAAADGGRVDRRRGADDSVCRRPERDGMTAVYRR